MPYACFGMPAARLNIDHFFNSCNKFLLVEAQTSSFLTHKKKTCFNLEKVFQTSKKKSSSTPLLQSSAPQISVWVVHRYMKTMQNV